MINKMLRCIHRHTIKEHPRCFAKGLIKSKTWYDNLKIGYLDIESTGFYADFDNMLTWAIKEKDGTIYTDTVTKEDLFSGVIDRKIVKSCIDKMREFDVVCTYFGTNFDIKFLRSRALYYGFDFPGFELSSSVNKNGEIKYIPISELFHWDLYYLVKSKLKLRRSSLENVCSFLNIDGKTKLDGDVWRRAKYGDPKALKEVLDHNIYDVIILERLHEKLSDFAKWIKKPL